MAFVPFTKDEQPTMAAFNEKFEQAIQQALADGVKIEVGSYVGTGAKGSSNPMDFVFDFEPRLFGWIRTKNSTGVISEPDSNYYPRFIIPTVFPDSDYEAFGSNKDSHFKKIEKGFSVYFTNDTNMPNIKNYVYHYIAIG